MQFKSYELFTESPQPAKMMLGEASASFCIPVTGKCKNEKKLT